MNIRKLKRSKKPKAATPSPRILTLLSTASSCLETGHLHQAKEICREILHISPRTSEAYNMLGYIYQENGKIDQAIEGYKKAVSLDTANDNALYNLGTLLGKNGQYEQAATALRKSLALAPRKAATWNNLGLVQSRMGNLAEAIRSLEKATELNPRYGEAWHNLGDALYCSGHLQKAVDAFQHCIRLIPDFVEAHYNLSIARHDLQQLPEAIASLERTLELAPDHAAARHMLAALRGETPENAPLRFVSSLFDQYATRFEADLVNRLEYRIPTRLHELLAELLPAGSRFSRVIDLGCGTGLSGQPFHNIADYLAGIDISPKMLEESRKKKIYNDLFLGDICEQLHQLPGLYDLFIAADVMIYIGKLEQIFTTVSSKAAPRCYFVFSVESHDGKDFILRHTGRYAHSADYISRLAAESGFTIVKQEQAGIRKEGDTWIPGELFILQKLN